MDFNEALNMKMDDIKRPPNPPKGLYVISVTKNPTNSPRSSPKGEWDVIDFPVKLIDVHSEVDPEELAAFGGVGSAMPMRVSFMLDKNDETKAKQSLFRLKTFVEDHLKVEASTLKEALSNCAGAKCLGFVTWRPDPNNSDTVYAEISKTAPLD